MKILVNRQPKLEHEKWLTNRAVHDSQTLKQEMEKIADCFPFVTYHIIGRSVLGQPIYELNIGEENAEKERISMPLFMRTSGSPHRCS